MLRIIAASMLVLALAACSGSDGNGGASKDDYAAAEMSAAMAPMPSPPPPPPAMDLARSADGVTRAQIIQQEPGGGGGQPGQPAPVQMMSYTYGWAFAVPTDNMQGLLNAHKKLCEDAGPAKCYVTNSNLDAIGKAEGSSGYLSMRATEDWVRAFEKGVSDGIKPFGASVYSNNRSAEDLTTQIVDGEARLKSMIAYRDGLQAMLRDKPGRLSDLLEIQQTLAQAQGDIDSRESTLAALRLRVSMSVLNFSYQPEYATVSQSIWRPLGDAFGDFVPSFARTLADIVRFIAAILPVVVFGGILIWLVVLLFGWRGRNRKKNVTTPGAAKTPSGTA